MLCMHSTLCARFTHIYVREWEHWYEIPFNVISSQKQFLTKWESHFRNKCLGNGSYWNNHISSGGTKMLMHGKHKYNITVSYCNWNHCLFQTEPTWALMMSQHMGVQTYQVLLTVCRDQGSHLNLATKQCSAHFCFNFLLVRSQIYLLKLKLWKRFAWVNCTYTFLCVKFLRQIKYILD